LFPDSALGWGISAAVALMIGLIALGESPPTQPSEDSSMELPVCRICYSGAEAGRLFSPCHCSGTMAYVHVKCLNQWRCASSNPRSFFTCDQCGYSYRTRRTAVAAYLQSERLVWLTSSALVGVLTLLGALVPFAPEQWLYHAAEWKPRRAWGEWWGPICDRCVAGLMLPALLGFMYELYQRLMRDRGGSVHGFLAALAIISFAQSSISPTMLFCCAFYFWANLANGLRAIARRLLLRFGEVLLAASTS